MPSTRRSTSAGSPTTSSGGCARTIRCTATTSNGIWVVSKYEDISYVERQPELFCSGQGVRPKGGGADALSIVSMDDPEHARQRRLISRGFTGARITQLMDHIRELAHGLVDDVAARGECDFVDDIAKPLPLIVIAEMLGLGIEDRERLAHWSDTMMAGEGADCRRPAPGGGGRSVGRVHHLPRRAARGAARAPEGRPHLGAALVGRRGRDRVRRAGAPERRRRAERSRRQSRSRLRRPARVLGAAARRRQRDDAQRAVGRDARAVELPRTSGPSSSATSGS